MLGQWGAAAGLSVSPSPQMPLLGMVHAASALLSTPVPVALLARAGSLLAGSAFSSGCPCFSWPSRSNGRGWARQGLGTEFLLCAGMCVLSCSRFDFEALESGDDGAFDKLRSWSRSIEDLQPPSALSAPFTNSLARSARQSVLRYVCSRSARLPPTLAPIHPGPG